MPIAAVPNYLGQDFREASPGLRFGMFLRLWGINRRSNALLWSKQDIGYEVRGQERFERQVSYDNKTPAINEAGQLTTADQKTLHALLARQRAAFAARADAQAGLCLEAEAIAPFTTGLGNEHPLENGFAFLNPYGLPYLPGSGVKGVIRRAAQELADGMWGDSHGWSHELRYSIEVGSEKDKRTIQLSMLDALFGREPAIGDSDHVRGALTFWDVIPQIAGNSLMVEIMTPHQSHYYQQNRERKSGDSTTPHDSGQPNPICFLTVPPESSFVFHVVCDTAHLECLAPKLAEADEMGAPRWKALVEAAFEHAFQWLGFGAKTAVGYGAMRRDREAERQAIQLAREETERQARLAAIGEHLKQVEDFKKVMQRRFEELRGRKVKPHGEEYIRAKQLAQAALGSDWTPEEKRAAAEAIVEWLPKVVQVDMKEERKKLKLAMLKGES